MFKSLSASILSLSLCTLSLGACDAKRDTPAAGVSSEALALAQSLLRGELAAVATYEDVIKQSATASWSPQLATILQDHKDAAAKLRVHVVALGGQADAGAGVWGAWTDLLAKGAVAISDALGRAVLETGEKQGISDYERVLNHAKADASTKALIRNDLLERTRAHIAALQAMKG